MAWQTESSKSLEHPIFLKRPTSPTSPSVMARISSWQGIIMLAGNTIPDLRLIWRSRLMKFGPSSSRRDAPRSEFGARSWVGFQFRVRVSPFHLIAELCTAQRVTNYACMEKAEWFLLCGSPQTVNPYPVTRRSLIVSWILQLMAPRITKNGLRADFWHQLLL